jgi:hypothetical protein
MEVGEGTNWGCSAKDKKNHTNGASVYKTEVSVSGCLLEKCLVVCFVSEDEHVNNGLVTEQIQEYTHVLIGQSMEERFGTEQQSKLG